MRGASVCRSGRLCSPSQRYSDTAILPRGRSGGVSGNSVGLSSLSPSINNGIFRTQSRRFGLLGVHNPKTFNRNPILDFKINGCQVYLFNMAHWVDPCNFIYSPVAHEPLNDISANSRKSLAAFLDIVEPDTIFVDICPSRIRSYARWILDNPRPERAPRRMRSAEHPNLLKNDSKLKHSAFTRIDQRRSEEEIALDSFEDAFTSEKGRLLGKSSKSATGHQSSPSMQKNEEEEQKQRSNKKKKKGAKSAQDLLVEQQKAVTILESPFQSGRWPKDLSSLAGKSNTVGMPFQPNEEVIKASISRKIDSGFAEKLYRIDKINMVRNIRMTKQKRLLALQDVEFDELDYWMFDQYYQSFVDSYSATVPNLREFQKEFYMCIPRWRHLSVTYGEELAMAMFYSLLGSFESYAHNRLDSNAVLFKEGSKELAMRLHGMNEDEQRKTLSMNDCLRLNDFLNGLEMFAGFDESSKLPMKNLNIQNTHMNGGIGGTVPTEDLQILTGDNSNSNNDSNDSNSMCSAPGLGLMRNACNQVMEIRSDQNNKHYWSDSSRRLIMGGMPQNIICDKIRECRKPNWWIHMGLAIRAYYEDAQQVNHKHETSMVCDLAEFAFVSSAREYKFVGWDGMLETMEMLDYVQPEIYDLLIIEQSDYISRCIEAASHTSDTLVAICGAGMAEGIIENLTGQTILDALEKTGLHARYYRTGEKTDTHILDPW